MSKSNIDKYCEARTSHRFNLSVFKVDKIVYLEIETDAK